MKKDEAYKRMEELRVGNKTFNKFVSKLEFKIDYFIAKNRKKQKMRIEIAKVMAVKMTSEEKNVLVAYLTHKYVDYLECDEIVLVRHKFFYSVRRFRVYLM